MTVSPEPKRAYYVSMTMRGVQSYRVYAHSAADAVERANRGEGDEPDFYIDKPISKYRARREPAEDRS